jgi:SAM-dependent methyltransferase
MTPLRPAVKFQITTPADLMKLATAFRQSRIVLTAFELGVFTALGKRRMPSFAVSKALRADARGIDRLMNALCALGLLRKRGGRFSNTPFSAEYLVRGEPGYLGGLAHTANLWHGWTTLTEAVSHGGTVLRRQAWKGSPRKRTRGFIAAMHQRASIQAAESVKLLNLSGVHRTLDVGGGSGAYSMALVRAGADIKATVFDLPDVMALTRAYVRKAHLTRRFAFLAGDFRKDDFGKGYDLILLSAIIHMNSAADNKRLFRKCAKALNPGGRLVVQDYIMDESRTRPAAGAYFALNMLVGTKAGDTFTEREVRGWMRAAGLSKIRRFDTPFESSLMIGIKR